MCSLKSKKAPLDSLIQLAGIGFTLLSQLNSSRPLGKDWGGELREGTEGEGR